ncbi:hypothetical protein, partial [Tenacibaculum ovolyticum]|uniref:hypothetical protein n=1 Tax=Tenacibaculum ovolyticum TaxID=104270 RepID=UPI000B147539
SKGKGIIKNIKTEKNNDLIKIINKKNSNIKNFTILAEDKTDLRVPKLDTNDSFSPEMEVLNLEEDNSYIDSEIFDVQKVMEEFKEMEEENLLSENENDIMNDLLKDNDINSEED